MAPITKDFTILILGNPAWAWHSEQPSGALVTYSDNEYFGKSQRREGEISGSGDWSLTLAQGTEVVSERRDIWHLEEEVRQGWTNGLLEVREGEGISERADHSGWFELLCRETRLEPDNEEPWKRGSGGSVRDPEQWGTQGKQCTRTGHLGASWGRMKREGLKQEEQGGNYCARPGGHGSLPRNEGKGTDARNNLNEVIIGCCFWLNTWDEEGRRRQRGRKTSIHLCDWDTLWSEIHKGRLGNSIHARRKG